MSNARARLAAERYLVQLRTVDLTDAQYDVADALTAALDAKPDQTHTVSGLARKAKCEHHEAIHVLSWLAARTMILSTGNGTWTRYQSYSARR
jgi:hypothetical protein